MKNLFLIDGASGTGKSDLIKYATDYDIKCTYIEKYTTRELREYEKSGDSKLDLVPLSSDDFKSRNFDYSYNYGGFQYGFDKQDVVDKFEDHEVVIIIIRNTDLIKKLKSDFQFLNVVSIFIYTDKDLIVSRLKKDNHSQEDIDFRLERLDIAFKSYLKNPTFYDELIINTGSLDDFHRIIENTFDNYKKTLKKENAVFVIMSFNPDLKWVYDEMKYAIKDFNQSNNKNLIPERIDDRKGKSFQITNGILEKIEEAELIICDLTEERPNVYYELGYTGGKAKNFILLAQEGTPLHFDISGYNVEYYKNATELKKKLIQSLNGYYKV